jgi:ubiquinone/menaquinone biosynthesis C-methylase UbiE
VIGQTLRRALVRQFAKPSGIVGHLAGIVMERRPSNRQRNLRTLEILEIQPDDSVLEIGVGPGFAFARAVERASRGRLIGVDHSEVMLRRAARRVAPAIAAGRAELLLTPAEELELPEGSVDKAYAVNVFMFWRDPEAVLRRLLPVLRPGGRLAITHQPRQPRATSDDTRRDADRIAAALVAAGFATVRAELLPMRPVDAACVLGIRPTLDHSGTL